MSCSFLCLLKLIIAMSNIVIQVRSLFTGFNQNDQFPYMQKWNNFQRYSYQEQLPSLLTQTCKSTLVTTSNSQVDYLNLTTIELNGNFTSNQFQNLCGETSLCVLSSKSTLFMNGNLNVAALKILGTLIWNETLQTSSFQFLCAGYVVVEGNGIFKLSVDSASKKAYVFIKNNGAVHNSLRTRVFGGFNTDTTIHGPTIDVEGRSLKRTWSLLYRTVSIGSDRIQLIHNPRDMGWQIGDRILIAPTTLKSSGFAETFKIKAINTVDNTIIFEANITNQVFSSNFVYNGTSTVLMSAEVINLSRNVIISGDDFNHIKCDPKLTGTISSLGCACNSAINRTICTMGLHTIMSGKGVLKVQYSRIEKCGQRGVFSKYCLHFHRMGASSQSTLRGNAIENSQQRGIVIHGTHLTTVEDNVLSDVRGTGIFIQDGNEMYNKIKYNVVICPTPKSDPNYGGCTVPGTDNGQSDTANNQAGLWSIARTNDVIGNRFANSFNGMFYDFSNAYGAILNPYSAIMGRLEGNTFHGHGRFGTYILSYHPRYKCIGSLSNNGFLTSPCNAFNNSGMDTGYAVVLKNNVDYGNVFVGGYDYTDVQYEGHVAINNLNNLYWKESKNMVDGCSAHVANAYFEDGNIALPDSAAFVFENTVFTGNTGLETNHHCNEGPAGFLCMPTYIFSNVTFKAMSSKTWVIFHVNGNSYGSILVLPPSEASNPLGAGGFFPPTFNSFVSSYYSYLLNYGNTTCQRAGDIKAWPGISLSLMDIRYAGGIFCKKPLRSLKIYTRGLSYATANNMLLEVWQNNKLITSFTAKFHQIGLDLPTKAGKPQFQKKQGYAFPVIADSSYEHRLSMINPNGNLPSDWVVEFSDPIFGNRWTSDMITLTVQGQGCIKKLVTSQHDRRWVWSDSSSYPSSQAWGRGACSATNPDMPSINCSQVTTSIKPLSCNSECSSDCPNGYCDCGSKQCICDAGFSGVNCTKNICDEARCGPHGKCIATYLGGDLLPSQGTCVCDQGWSGPNCDQHVCSGVTCSGRGYCQAKGDTDYQCICESAYSGTNCEKVKQEICGSICPSTFLNICGMGSAVNKKMFICNAGSGPQVGCFASTFYVPIKTASACCYENCDKCNLVNCPSATNDCHLSGSCNPLDGTCRPQIQRTDGAPCNSIPNGICFQGICLPSVLTVNNQSYPVETPSPSFTPVSPKPTQTPSMTPKYPPSIKPIKSSNSPSFKPTKTPSVTPTFLTTSFTPTIEPSVEPSLQPSYIPTAITLKYEYLGCYGDNLARAMIKSLGKVASIKDCYNLAFTNKYQLYGLQYGGECWISNNLTHSIMYGLCGSCANNNCGKPTCNCAAMKCASGENCGDGYGTALYNIYF